MGMSGAMNGTGVFDFSRFLPFLPTSLSVPFISPSEYDLDGSHFVLNILRIVFHFRCPFGSFVVTF